jgi:hypothetical protein
VEIDNLWVFDNETKIISKLNSFAIPTLKQNFTNMKFQKGITITNLKSRLTGTIFPTIYVHEMSGTEKGQTIDGQAINAVTATYQVDVIVNTQQSDAKKILAIVASVFKRMRFEVISMPEFDSEEKIYRSTARFRRLIAANDRLLDQ